ncbi:MULTISPECIES: hypothetical protein [unclassified Streptomyces]|uniref:hypothetical protein n=1 Tax=unclassified Streptomyces TaxID=2593676 RepID=UPI0035D66A84
MIDDRNDIGHRVEDGAARTGVLCAVDHGWEDPAKPPGKRRKQRVAFVRPEGGGLEWMVPPDTVRRL